jgi:hypothetical protein
MDTWTPCAGDGQAAEDRDVARAVEQIAELALLGLGSMAQVFPETIEEAEEAFAEEQTFRVIL